MMMTIMIMTIFYLVCYLITPFIDYHCQIMNLHKAQLYTARKKWKKKSALLPFKILIFSIIHHVACLKQFLSFRRDLNFNSHDSIFALAPSHAADVSRPLSSFSRCITVSLWGRREGMQTTNEHGRLQELGDSLSSDWAQICGFCCHIMVAFGEQGWVKNLVTSQWNWWRQMRMFPFKIIEWQWCESGKLVNILILYPLIWDSMVVLNASAEGTFVQVPAVTKTFSPGLSCAFPNHSSWTSVSPFPTPPSVSHAAVSTPPGQGPLLYHLSSRQLPSAPETPITTFWAQLWDVFVLFWFVCTFRWFLPHAVKIKKTGRLSRSRVHL